MTVLPLGSPLIKKAVEFHGHWCPGLARGIRVAAWAIEHFGTAADEEIVAVTETDMCAVDAIQALVGCTFGKGNLIFRNRGKVAFSFFRRSDGKCARIVERPYTVQNSQQMHELRALLGKPDLSAEKRTELEHLISLMREKECERFLSSPFEELFLVKAVEFPMPPQAQKLPTVICDGCGEGVMASMLQERNGKKICMDCLAAI